MTRDPTPQVSEELLHGYADGLLSEQDRRRVKAYLAAHPEKAAQVADWTRQNAAIDALFPRAEAEEHARALSLAARGPAPRAPWRQALRLAAMLALVAVGLAGGWLAPPGPYALKLAIRERRLVFDIATEGGARAAEFHLSLGPFRQVVKDYFQICEAYYDAVKRLPPGQIEAIDMGRRGIHDEGARILLERLQGKAELDRGTARRLFTLICVLHWGG